MKSLGFIQWRPWTSQTVQTKPHGVFHVMWKRCRHCVPSRQHRKVDPSLNSLTSERADTDPGIQHRLGSNKKRGDIKAQSLVLQTLRPMPPCGRKVSTPGWPHTPPQDKMFSSSAPFECTVRVWGQRKHSADCYQQPAPGEGMFPIPLLLWNNVTHVPWPALQRLISVRHDKETWVTFKYITQRTCTE